MMAGRFTIQSHNPKKTNSVLRKIARFWNNMNWTIAVDVNGLRWKRIQINGARSLRQVSWEKSASVRRRNADIRFGGRRDQTDPVYS